MMTELTENKTESRGGKALLILAAGLGSRYGGGKQTDGLGAGGLPLMAYSIYDAVRAGFDRVVFVVRPEERTTVEAIADKIHCLPSAVFVPQSLSLCLPRGLTLPPERTRPLGTVHALLCAAEFLDVPFAVVNADDFYGAQAYQVAAELLDRGLCGLSAFSLEDTLSESGGVNRGICYFTQGTEAFRRLIEVKETFALSKRADGRIVDRDGLAYAPTQPVSMNLFALQPTVLHGLKRLFATFAEEIASDPEALLRGEFPLSVGIDRLVRQGLPFYGKTVDGPWFGVTYREDREAVREKLRALHTSGLYPEAL